MLTGLRDFATTVAFNLKAFIGKAGALVSSIFLISCDPMLSRFLISGTRLCQPCNSFVFPGEAASKLVWYEFHGRSRTSDTKHRRRAADTYSALRWFQTEGQSDSMDRHVLATRQPSH